MRAEVRPAGGSLCLDFDAKRSRKNFAVRYRWDLGLVEIGQRILDSIWNGETRLAWIAEFTSWKFTKPAALNCKVKENQKRDFADI